MSNVGQGALSIVGGVVGFIYGGPMGAAYGLQLGYLAGTALFPTQLPHMQGPRLGEGQSTSAVVGAPIPWVFGTQRVGGIVIWASPIREIAHTEEVGGKGGPEQSQTTYEYRRSFAILLCEGPISGVRRIWANGKLIYDRADHSDDGLTADSLQDLLAQLAALNSQWNNKMTIYLGTEDQEPDPTIESFEGVGNVPAYRGYAYVVFNDVQLKPEDGLRIPAQWSFEVYEDGDTESHDLTEYSNEVLMPWLRALDPAHPMNINTYQAWSFARDTDNPGGLPGPERDSLKDAWIDFANAWDATYPDGKRISRAPYHVGTARFGGLEEMYPLGNGNYGERVSLNLLMSEIMPTHYALDHTAPAGQQFDDLKARGPTFFVLGGSNLPSVRFISTIRNLGGDPSPHNPSRPLATAEESNIQDEEENAEIFSALSCYLRIKRAPSPPQDPCTFLHAIPFSASYCVVNGEIRPTGEWTYDDSTTYRVLSKYADNGTDVTSYPLNPARPQGHPDYDDQEFWEEAYELAVARGDLPEGLTYGVDYPVTQNFGYSRPITTDTVDPFPVTLASIVRRICERVGATPDVSDLEEIPVYGYTIARPMAARAAIEALRPYGFFDLIESGIEIKTVTRGKEAVVTLTPDDLGAHFSGEQRPAALTTSRALEKELPRQVRVRYQSLDRDMDPGEELSPVRVDTKAESVMDVDLPVAMLPTKAAQIAEVVLRDIWSARNVHQTQVDQGWSAIEPSDPIEIPVDGRSQRVRVPNIIEKLPNLRVLEMVRDDDGQYISYAVGNSAPNPPKGIDFYAPAEMVLLDIPALRSEDDNAGVYAAIRSAVRNTPFRGATIYKSADGGVSYTAAGGGTSETQIGRVVSALPSGPHTIWDEGNELIMELGNGELESKSEDEILEGANAAAIGVNGRWEIIQFRDAERVSGDVWKLTGLLRGRRGTEHNIGLSEEGDQFVLLDDLVRVPVGIGEVHAERHYKCVGVGLSEPATPAEQFTGEGVALMPFSPVHIHGTRDGDDLTIMWVRRDRMQIGYTGEDPMSEAYEDYEVEILDEDGEVLRIISTSNPAVTYTSAQQITDFGSVQSSIKIRIYQMSVAVGRGYPGEATI